MATLVVEDGTGKTNSNAYCTLDEADLYHEMRLHVSDWTGASDDDKEAAIMWATSLLDTLVTWNGYKYDEDQALLWPRDGVLDRAGYDIDVDEIPQFLKDATAEFARILIATDKTAETDTKGFKSIHVGSIQLSIDRYDRPGMLPKSVWNLVRFCCEKVARPSKTLVRG